MKVVEWKGWSEADTEFRQANHIEQTFMDAKFAAVWVEEMRRLFAEPLFMGFRATQDGAKATVDYDIVFHGRVTEVETLEELAELLSERAMQVKWNEDFKVFELAECGE